MKVSSAKLFQLNILCTFIAFPPPPAPNCNCCLFIKADVICLQLPNDMKMTTGADWEINNS